jgi:hypothetical protein
MKLKFQQNFKPNLRFEQEMSTPRDITPLTVKSPIKISFGYRSGGPDSIPGTTRKKKVVGLEQGPLSLVSTTEEQLHRKVAALENREYVRRDPSR